MTENITATSSMGDNFNSFVNEFAAEAKCFGRASLPTEFTGKEADIRSSVSMETVTTQSIHSPLPLHANKPLLTRLQAPTVSSARKSMAPITYLTRKPSSRLSVPTATVSSSRRSSTTTSPSASSKYSEKPLLTRLQAPTESSARKSVAPITYLTRKSSLKLSSKLSVPPATVSASRRSLATESPSSSKYSEKPLLTRLQTPTVSSLRKSLPQIAYSASQTSMTPAMTPSSRLLAPTVSSSTRKSLAPSTPRTTMTPSARLLAPTVSSKRKSLVP